MCAVREHSVGCLNSVRLCMISRAVCGLFGSFEGELVRWDGVNGADEDTNFVFGCIDCTALQGENSHSVCLDHVTFSCSCHSDVAASDTRAAVTCDGMVPRWWDVKAGRVLSITCQERRQARPYDTLARLFSKPFSLPSTPIHASVAPFLLLLLFSLFTSVLSRCIVDRILAHNTTSSTTAEIRDHGFGDDVLRFQAQG